MDYITAQEIAEKWGVTPRQVQRLISGGRIPGAKRMGHMWLIPADAEKPLDPRKLPREEHAVYQFLTTADLPKADPDAALSGLAETLRPLAAADIAFRRGDPEKAKEVWRETSREDITKLSAASLATAAAISSGDYELYGEIQHFLQVETEKALCSQDKALLSLPAALTAVSMAVPQMTPEWLKTCEFSFFPHALRPFLLYLHALYLRNIGEYAELLGVAKTALELLAKPATFTWLDVYFGVLCANAAYMLGDTEQAERYLTAALALGMPCGFIAPFADMLGSFGGMLEMLIEQHYPEQRKTVIELWERSFKNWMRFHNKITEENITTILNQQEYQAAILLAHGATYSEVSARMSLSVSRIKNILAEVYGKLDIQKKQDLKQFII